MNQNLTEKVLKPKKGFTMLAVEIALFIISVIGIIMLATETVDYFLGIVPIVCLILLFIFLPGFKVVGPNEAVVLLLFGKYYGSIKTDGFFWVNPFCVSFNPTKKSPFEAIAQSDNENNKIVGSVSTKKVSLKAVTLNNAKQKVNDEDGNPIEIGVVVTWRVADTAKAVFNVENYLEFVSVQADAAIRHVARLYPYDMSEGSDEKSLRGSTQEVAEDLKQELHNRVEIAGIEILEARIAHLAYAPEIASAMLQRQQAKAIIIARQKIVEGAVGMVDMALKMLNEGNIVELDDERKAQMVSNLLVVLCGNKDAQPIVNSGTIY